MSRLHTLYESDPLVHDGALWIFPFRVQLIEWPLRADQQRQLRVSRRYTDGKNV